MSAPKKKSTSGQRPALDAEKSKAIQKELRDAANALGATKLLAQHPWNAALDLPKDKAKHSPEVFANALAFTEQLCVRAGDFEKLDHETRKHLLKSLKTHKKSDIAELKKIVSTVTKRSRPVIEETEEAIRHFGRTLSAELAKDLQAAEVADIKRYLEGYIHARFDEVLREQTVEAGARIEGIAKHAQTLINDNWNRHATQALGPVAAKLDLRIDTFRFDMGVMALSAVGLSLMFSNLALGGLLTLAAPAAAFAIKGRLDKQSKARAEREVPQQVLAVADRLANELGTRLAASVAALFSRIEQYGTLWPTVLLESLQHADKGLAKLDDAKAALKRATTKLSNA